MHKETNCTYSTAFAWGTLLTAGLVVTILRGCGGGATSYLPDSIYVEATGSGEVTVGVDQHPPVHLEHEGDVSVYWDIDSWPPKVLSSNAEQCARLTFMFFQHESEGCNEEETLDTSPRAEK